jgi:3-oxoacyl-[acyl-carrier-protein] synthase-3
MRYAAITGWGKCLPPAVLSNADFEQLIDTTNEWIVARTGIKERRITEAETSDMAAVAGRRALAAAGRGADAVDLIVLATCSPDRLVPGAAAMVQHKIGATNAGALDVNAACSGFIYALAMGTAQIRAGSATTVLVIGAEKLSTWIDLHERSTAVLFGDGAGAVVLEASDEPEGLLQSELGSDGSLAEILTVKGSGTELMADGIPGDTKIEMEGREVFKRAVLTLGEASARVTAAAGLALEDVDLLVPHQANARIIDATAKRLGIGDERVFTNIGSYGNTSAASIPIALCEAVESGRVRPGADIVLAAFGGGLTWAAGVVKWGDRIDPIGVSDAALPPATLGAVEMLEQRHRTRLGPR